jgi:cytochrome oxidase Cu insertion factor (SCO1/SenC/PrrC family)
MLGVRRAETGACATFMSEGHSTAASPGGPGPDEPGRRRIPAGWAIGVAVVITAGIAGAGFAFINRHAGSQPAAVAISGPNIVWAAAKRQAPDFRLHDQAGLPISLRAARGRVVILTFIDPVCTTLCPLEARVLDQVELRLPRGQRPAIVAVSVNPWADQRRYFRQDARRWRLDSNWRWAVGDPTRLARVWQAYKIGVRSRRQVIAGVTVHQVDHVEAAYVIDPQGDLRALFLFPFAASDLERTVRQLQRS